MKILITGMTSRMTSFSRESSFPSLLARSLSIFGHDVSMLVEYSGAARYDAVIAGLASPLAPSSTYLVPTAQTIDEAQQQGKLAAVYIDDPDISKIIHGCASALRRPDRLEKPFYASRPGMQAFAENPSLHATVMAFIERMSAWSWDTVLWPGHPWAQDKVAGSGYGSFRSVPVDPTAALRQVVAKRWPDTDDVPGRNSPPGAHWVAETTYFQDHVFDPSISRQVYDVMTGDELTKTSDMFAMSYGVIHGNSTSPGWWTPFPYLAALTGRIYIPHPDEGRLMGESYYVLPSAVENLDPTTYSAMAAVQMKQHEEVACTRRQLNETLNSVLGSPVS